MDFGGSLLILPLPGPPVARVAEVDVVAEGRLLFVVRLTVKSDCVEGNRGVSALPALAVTRRSSGELLGHALASFEFVIGI
jgi:hypothetical protein